ncbi:hypothetical protein [Anaerotignum sp. MB30-C6]|uniref:hypothetical protein n=1 Tax=Anaerotignum sp. MB30-C6 TaxID=3070814 RepID=UPI0027DD86A0|nr:hypothetical protein [Anaerotignum sp. MB30-C6]WMI80067.1 hypothetical protein RBQ60_09480 [Anaerotignum sp. MB30-C6]
MKRNLKVLLGSLIIVCVCLVYYFYSNHQQIHGLDSFPRTDVTVYIYQTGLGHEKDPHIQIEQADYESFLKIISSIKYMNPKIDPTALENRLYGFNDYELEVIQGNTRKTFNICDDELRPNQRAIFFSDWNTSITAYVKDDVYKEYERLAKKYLKNSEDG